MCITDGLLTLSDDMILGVLAHEIGHLSYRHTVIQLLIGGGNLFTQLLKDDNFTKRTLPVIISLPKTKDRTYSFFDPRYRIEIISFWENEAKTLKEAIEKLSLENKVELSMEYRRINNYSQDVSKFMNWFKSKLVGVIPSDTSSSKRKQAALEIADKIDNIISGKQ